MDKENKVCINSGVLFIHEKCKKGCYWTTDRTENQHPERQMLHVQSKTNKQTKTQSKIHQKPRHESRNYLGKGRRPADVLMGGDLGAVGRDGQSIKRLETFE